MDHEATAEANLPPAVDGDDAQFRNRFRTLFTQFADRVASEPGVAAFTLGAHYPNTNLTEMPVDVDGVPLAAVGERAVQTTAIATDFLEAFEAPMVAGREFTAADSAPGQSVAIVDQTFVGWCSVDKKPWVAEYVMRGDRRRGGRIVKSR